MVLCTVSGFPGHIQLLEIVDIKQVAVTNIDIYTVATTVSVAMEADFSFHDALTDSR